MQIKQIAFVAAIFLNALPAQAVERIERGNLVMEDVPAIPPALAERTNRYQQTRSASLAGWLARDQGLLISTRFAETAQVHLVAAPGADRRQLTFFAEPVAEVAAAPDGQHFLFTKDVGGGEFYQVYQYDLGSGDIQLLSDGKARNTDLRWSSSGERFAYSTTRRNGKDTDVVIGTPGKTEVRAVTAREGAWSALDFSPDGRRLLLSHYVSANESELYLADLSGDGLPELQRFHPASEPVSFSTARFSRDGRGVYYVSDQDSDFQRLRYEQLDGSAARVLTADTHWDVEQIELSGGGSFLAYTVNADGISQLHLLDLKTGKSLSVPALPAGVISGLEFDAGGKRLGFNLNNARNPTDVFSIEVGSGASRKLTRWTRSETGGLNASTFTEPQLIHVNSFDGLQVPAFYYRGLGDGPRPVLISIHGGPESQALPSFNPLIEFYARELGISVLVPNVRGSSGYGKKYLTLDNGRLREDSVRDIGALLDWIATQPELNAERVAVMGGSYGGYMTLASMTRYNNRLRGGIDVVGISNWVTFLTNTQDYRRDLRRAEYGDESDPKMRAFLQAISPTTNAARITRPMFIVQGANDPRVPASEAEQMVETIRNNNGGEVWYLLAKDEGHGFRKKANRDLYNNAAILFLQKILLE
ncbi:S9 family peptidase [Hydrocarboniphaga sp.]|uniref:S9 family peptidase n=1 Tax=Hydrocarboniphaga sp. TaxID=2033016 RepID=UPI003D0C78E3